MKKFLNFIINGFLAGICISIGGWLSLRANVLIQHGAILGAFLFSIGLILICNFGFHLYTGKICYLFDKNEEKYSSRAIRLSLVLLGNLIGSLFMGQVIRYLLKENNEVLFNTLENSISTKLSYDSLQVIGLSFFCGMLVYIAVEGFNKIENVFGKYVVLMMSISGFIISGFEHSIADMFYFFLNSSFSVDVWIFIALCVLGNSLGGVFIPLLKKIRIN